MNPQRIVVIGGASGMGFETARLALAQGDSVLIAGRSQERLEQARQSLASERVDTFAADIGDRVQMKALFSRAGSVDHIAITAADLPYGPVTRLAEADLMRAVRSKFLGPIFAAQEAASRLCAGGSITLTSGIAAKRPMRGGVAAASINGAVEGLTRALAIELGPLRVNAVSPGWTDTPIWDSIGFSPEQKDAKFAEMAAKLPIRRIGRAQEMASAILFLMKHQFITGTVLHVDGGHQLV
jgi:NAD(P)-dependent dehydrogenase (short-subunit alcohol dehydrogenase family)